jgi:hypothetical protein
MLCVFYSSTGSTGFGVTGGKCGVPTICYQALRFAL